MLLAKRIMKDYLAFYAICVYDIEVLAILHATTLTSAIYVYLPYIVYPSPALIELYKLSLPLFCATCTHAIIRCAQRIAKHIWSALSGSPRLLARTG